MKTVYTVRGSEDGVIGIYSSKKRALGKARSYVEQNDTIEEEDLDSKYVWSIHGHSSYADVEKWDVE